MGICYKRYSVYRSNDDMPIILFATSRECAAALGIQHPTLLSYFSKQRNGSEYPKKYRIYADEIDQEEKDEWTTPKKLSAIDYRIIATMYIGSTRICETASRIKRHYSTVSYHIKKIRQITGLDPKNENDLKLLAENIQENTGTVYREGVRG